MLTLGAGDRTPVRRSQARAAAPYDGQRPGAGQAFDGSFALLQRPARSLASSVSTCALSDRVRESWSADMPRTGPSMDLETARISSTAAASSLQVRRVRKAR